MTTPQTWVPRSPSERMDGLVWLPRLIDKGRRFLEGGQDLMGEYMFGDNDFFDAFLLRHLGLNDEAVLTVLREEADDLEAARTLIGLSKRSRAANERWSDRFERLSKTLFWVIDADEGRKAPGPVADLAKLWYNRLLIPPVLSVFKLLERQRATRQIPLS